MAMSFWVTFPLLATTTTMMMVAFLMGASQANATAAITTGYWQTMLGNATSVTPILAHKQGFQPVRTTLLWDLIL